MRSFSSSRPVAALSALLLALWVEGPLRLCGVSSAHAAAPTQAEDPSSLAQQADALLRRLYAQLGRVHTHDVGIERLTQQASQLATQIETLKSQAPGVGTDLRLSEHLAQSQVLAQQLSAEQTALQGLRSETRRTRTQLIGLCDRLLESEEGTRLTLAERLSWLKTRTEQSEALLAAEPALTSRVVTQAEAVAGRKAQGEGDDPERLRERADLLRDSADKVRRELARLRARDEELTRRERLRERARRVDEDLFAEQAASRRSAGNRAVAGAERGPSADASSAPPVFTGPGAAGTTGGGTSEVRVAPRGPDPSTLDSLLSGTASVDRSARQQAILRAQKSLQILADDLALRASQLEQQAQALSRQK